jgi:uncharacterized protein (TIGR02118 family)
VWTGPSLRGGPVTRQIGRCAIAIKRITAANEHLTNGRTREHAQRYWAETHGKLVANNPNLKRYHHYFSLPEAYENDPRPTFIGISMFWREDPFAVGAAAAATPGSFGHFYQNQPGGSDDRQLFGREPRWPTDDQHGDILGEEHFILDGPKTPTMVNAIFMVNKLPGLDHRDFYDHWLNVHAPIAAKLPGLLRYIQNHGLLDNYKAGTATHDGWSELWFDDYASFQKAVASPEWQAMESDGATLFHRNKGVVIGREYVQKDESWKARDYGAPFMSEDEIRDRLMSQGYKTLAADPSVPGRIKSAAAKGRIAVWTPEHLCVWEEPWIDARPDNWRDLKYTAGYDAIFEGSGK